MLPPRDRRGVWTGRLLMLLILAAAITVTYNATSLIGIAVVLAGMYGATATIYWGQWWWWRVNIYSWIVAMAGGPLIYAALGGLSLGSWRVPGLLQQSAWWTSQRGASESAALGMDMLQAAIGAGFTAFLWIAVTLATSPEPMEVLTRFYRTARPMGAWGPVRRACLAEDPQWNPPERGLLLRGLALALLGASWISAGVIGIGGLFIGKWITSACLLAGAVAGCVLFRRAFDRRLQCMDADERTLAE